MKLFKKINTIVLFVAIALFLTVLVVYLLEEILQPAFQIMLHIAIYVSIYYIVVNAFSIMSSFRRKIVRETTGVLLLIPVFFGIFSMIYLIAEGHKMRFDHTVSKKFTLSPQTINIVSHLDQDITILCFFKDGQPGKEMIKTGIEQYQYVSKKIHCEFIDPDKYPHKAKQYGIESYGEVVFISDLGQEKVKEVVNEESITNAILKVISEDKVVIYFVTGHGEPSLDNMERKGFGLLARQLTVENYEVKEISLMRSSSIPRDASCVILAAPETDLFKEEQELLQKYIFEEGGSLLVLGDIDAPVTVREFVAEWGVTLGRDVIIDKMSQLFGANYETAVIAQYGKHPITEGFNVASFFPTTSSVTMKDELPNELRGAYLAYSGAGSWAETNMQILKEESKATLDQDDMRGPVPVGVVITKEIKTPQTQQEDEGEKIQTDEALDQRDTREAKIVIFGDADFITNAHLRLSGNRDLFLNTIAWLSGEETLISIRPKEVDATPLFLRKGQSRMLFFVPVVFMPLIVITIGIMVFVRRRRG
ncbi:MAG: GldG family protein [Candidatus Omnitrophica bacterium]|nr:GldG family protein [Candidatus Omnitrophota bacterium]